MKRDTVLGFRVSPREFEMVSALASIEGRNLSETVRECIRECASRRGLFEMPAIVEPDDVFKPQAQGVPQTA